MDSHGQWTTDQHSIDGIFVCYFQEIYTSSGFEFHEDLSCGVRGWVTPDMNSFLCKSFTAKKVKTSLL